MVCPNRWARKTSKLWMSYSNGSSIRASIGWNKIANITCKRRSFIWCSPPCDSIRVYWVTLPTRPLNFRLNWSRCGCSNCLCSPSFGVSVARSSTIVAKSSTSFCESSSIITIKNPKASNCPRFVDLFIYLLFFFSISNICVFVIIKNNLFPERGTCYDYYFEKKAAGHWREWTDMISRESSEIPENAKVKRRPWLFPSTIIQSSY